MISVPLTFSYVFLRNKKVRPYVQAGAGLRYMLSAEQQDPIKSFSTSQLASVSGPAIDIKDERNALNFEVVLGGGAKLKIPRGDVFLDVRYNLGLNNQRNEESDLNINDDERLWNYNISDNDFTINNLLVSVGYNYYLYKPRKKKEKDE
jgi:hypothetical protein